MSSKSVVFPVLKSGLIKALGAGLALGFIAAKPAQAGQVHWSIHVGLPVPAPVIVARAPAPVVVAPVASAPVTVVHPGHGHAVPSQTCVYRGRVVPCDSLVRVNPGQMPGAHGHGWRGHGYGHVQPHGQGQRGWNYGHPARVHPHF